jgi:hypothetical protein
MQAALGGPIAAALAWLALVRLPVGRRVVGLALALGAHAAAWWVFWSIYRGDEVVWRSFDPELLGATIVVVTELALLISAFRAERVPDGGNAPAIVGLAVSASAVAALSYAGSLAVVALVIPLPSIAVAAAALSGAGRPDARGLIGLAAADVFALVGVSLVYARTGTAVVGEGGGAGPALLVFAALIKSGAIPGLATWRQSGSPGPGAWLDTGLRGQAVALAALAMLTMRSSAPAPALAAGAAALILVGGIVATVSRTEGRTLAALSGTAAGIPFLALGLGGAVGTRAFLLLFPALLLSSALVAALARPEPVVAVAAAEATVPRSAWGWLAACALGVALGSLLGLPPGGGFPGTWLAVSLAATRSEVALAWLVAVGATGVGLALAMKASVGLLRSARSTPLLACTGAAVALLLIYLGTQPVRVGLGWWVRVETALGLPEVLPTAGAPGLPVIGGMRLALALAPALLLVAVVMALGRGVRDAEPEPDPQAAPEEPRARRAGRVKGFLAPVLSAAKPVTDVLERARATGAGFGVAAVLEVAALLLAGRVVMLVARAGFL